MAMTVPRTILIAALLAPILPAPAQTAMRRDDLNGVNQRTQRGEIRPLKEIEGRVLPRMAGARYLGPELYDDRYRLKFMRDGAVIWVDVDARTGAIIGRAGN